MKQLLITLVIPVWLSAQTTSLIQKVRGNEEVVSIQHDSLYLNSSEYSSSILFSDNPLLYFYSYKLGGFNDNFTRYYPANVVPTDKLYTSYANSINNGIPSEQAALAIAANPPSLKSNNFEQIMVKAITIDKNGEQNTFSFRGQELKKAILKLKALDEDLIIEWDTTLPGYVKQYCYQLKNLNNNSIYSNFPKAQFTNLRGGDYILEVDIIENNQMIPLYRLPIKVEKRVTEEWWFWIVITVCVILPFLAIIYLLSMLNLRQKLNVQVMRNRIASDLHDDVGTTLDSIRFLAEMLEERFKKLTTRSKELLDRIIDESRDAAEKLDDTVWAVRPNNDSVHEMIEKIRSCAYTMLPSCGVKLNFNNELQPSEVVNITTEQRQNAYMIAKESIHNIGKHSEAPQAWIVIRHEKIGLRISIEDNGKGFDLKEVLEKDGDGLKNYYARAKASFIQFSLETQPGSGTRISMLIPEL